METSAVLTLRWIHPWNEEVFTCFTLMELVFALVKLIFTLTGN